MRFSNFDNHGIDTKLYDCNISQRISPRDGEALPLVISKRTMCKLVIRIFLVLLLILIAILCIWIAIYISRHDIIIDIDKKPCCIAQKCFMLSVDECINSYGLSFDKNSTCIDCITIENVVLPLLDAFVKKDEQSCYIHWGYNNTNSVKITIPIGKRNILSPTDSSQSMYIGYCLCQVSEFYPGVHHYAFAIRVNCDQEYTKWSLSTKDSSLNNNLSFS